MAIENPREIRGLLIAVKDSEVKRLNPLTYRVRSQSNPQKWYLVAKNSYNEWSCECPDHVHRRVVCKHIHAVKFSLKLRQKVTEENLNLEGVTLDDEISCPSCGSMEVVKDGKRKNKGKTLQRYSCKVCHYRFVVNIGFSKVKATPQAIMASLDLYFKGCSLRDIQDHLNQFYKIKVTHVAILKWVRKYMRLMRSYVEKLTPKTSGIWHTDEMTVNVNGELKWLWNLMDNDTRFLLASQIHKQRGVKDVREIFAEAKEKTKSMPIAVVHDGLRSYDEAFNKEFFTLANPRVQNVRSIGQRNGFNQLVERIHGTIRERDKVMRALDNEESAKEFIEAFKIWYNFLRPHMSLGGLTPAERAGIRLGLGENRWEDLIKQAYISRKLTSNHEKP